MRSRGRSATVGRAGSTERRPGQNGGVAVGVGFTLTRFETESGVQEMATRLGRGAAARWVARYGAYSETTDGEAAGAVRS
jgi:hypothetical protein